MSPSTKQIILENNQVIPEIFGSQDLNLKLIEKKFNVRITTRENQISIKGEPESLNSVENLFHQLEKLHESDQSVENGDIKFAIRLMAENPQADLLPNPRNPLKQPHALAHALLTSRLTVLSRWSM